MIAGLTFDEIQQELMAYLLRAPECSPRGQRVKERLAVTLRLRDPLSRLSTSPARAANYGFAAGEFCWYLRGAEDVESIAYYNRRMLDYSDDGKRLRSAYGRRLRAQAIAIDGSSQWELCLTELKKDPDSRRAVMTILSPVDLAIAGTCGTKDLPCTVAIQAFIRGDELNWHVTMRSNDAIWGLCNDLFSFTLLQETMLLDLLTTYPGLKMGSYYHTAGSMHLYERHFEMAEKIVEERRTTSRGQAMPPVFCRRDLLYLLADEERIRKDGKIEFASMYSGGARWLLDQLIKHRKKVDYRG